MKKRTKIIATHGPAIVGKQWLQDLYDAWVNIIRFNFSHANYENVREVLSFIRELNSEWNANLSTLLDTKGPEIRTGDLSQKNHYKKGDRFKFFVNQDVFVDNQEDLFCDYPFLTETAFEWQLIQIDSGLFQVKVIQVDVDFVFVEAQNDAIIGNRRHVNLPGIKLKLPWVTDKDKQDVAFAIAEKMDFIALSFVRNASNIQELQSILEEHDAKHIKVISKIENEEWVENISEIITASDGIMVARWDLGIEVPIEKLPVYQDTMMRQSLEQGKFTIIATHLLESMIENPFPTRAEVSDVFNSVMQRTDCVMLSWETAAWKYPINAVKVMHDTILEAEKSKHFSHYDFSIDELTSRDLEKKSLIRSAVYSGEELQVQAIFIFTKTGKLARLASWFRPNIPIYAFTINETSLRYMNALFWVYPTLLPSWDDDDFWKNRDMAVELTKDKWRLKKGDRVIVVNDIRKDGREIPLVELYDIA